MKSFRIRCDYWWCNNDDTDECHIKYYHHEKLALSYYWQRQQNRKNMSNKLNFDSEIWISAWTIDIQSSIKSTPRRNISTRTYSDITSERKTTHRWVGSINWTLITDYLVFGNSIIALLLRHISDWWGVLSFVEARLFMKLFMAYLKMTNQRTRILQFSRYNHLFSPNRKKKNGLLHIGVEMCELLVPVI